MAKITIKEREIFVFKGDENESDNKAKKDLKCGLEDLYTPERSAPVWICVPELSERKPLVPEIEEAHEADKETRETLARVIAPGVKTDATDEDPQVENVAMKIEENWVISLKQLHLNQSRMMLAGLKLNLQRRYL